MSGRSALQKLRNRKPQIAPSLLLCDFTNLKREIEQLERAQIDILHLDVMDGHFVPTLTYGPPLVSAFRKLTDSVLDVHLMISNAGDSVGQYADAGADSLTIHVEAVDNPRQVLQQIRSLGVGMGIALNPSTPLSKIEDCLDLADLILVMSVHPGFGGQTFQPVALEKLRKLQTLVDPEVLLQVDGGVNERTIEDCVEAGAHLLVIGSAIFNASDYPTRVQELRNLALSKGAVTE